MAMCEEEKMVLCGANAYDKKYYFNEKMKGIPESIQDELHIICVLFTEEVGGIFTIEFDLVDGKPGTGDATAPQTRTCVICLDKVVATEVKITYNGQ